MCQKIDIEVMRDWCDVMREVIAPLAEAGAIPLHTFHDLFYVQCFGCPDPCASVVQTHEFLERLIEQEEDEYDEWIAF